MVLPITLGSLTGKVGAINTDSSALEGVFSDRSTMTCAMLTQFRETLMESY